MFGEVGDFDSLGFEEELSALFLGVGEGVIVGVEGAAFELDVEIFLFKRACDFGKVFEAVGWEVLGNGDSLSLEEVKIFFKEG
jgi:hypothetical protein